jgi:hypothetical protein
MKHVAIIVRLHRATNTQPLDNFREKNMHKTSVGFTNIVKVELVIRHEPIRALVATYRNVVDQQPRHVGINHERQ